MQDFIRPLKNGLSTKSISEKKTNNFSEINFKKFVSFDHFKVRFRYNNKRTNHVCKDWPDLLYKEPYPG